MESQYTTVQITETPPASATPMVDQKRKIEEEELQAVLALLASTLEAKEDDKDQVSFVVAVQKNRKFLLEYAMQDYMIKPTSAKLETITSLLAHMEKVVRDDRKERAKKQENQDNILSFNQMLDAMSMIKKGSIVLPTFDLSNFMLDPNKPVVGIEDGAKPIGAEELVMGNQIVSIDGITVA